MQKRKLFLVIALCMLWLTGFAQNTIKGTVKDKTGEPLIGVALSLAMVRVRLRTSTETLV